MQTDLSTVSLASQRDTDMSHPTLRAREEVTDCWGEEHTVFVYSLMKVQLQVVAHVQSQCKHLVLFLGTCSLEVSVPDAADTRAGVKQQF